MDYEKKYNEALNDMRAIYPNLKGDAKLAVEHAFPELAESEDERIRKKLYCTVLGTPDDSEWFHDVSKDSILAYLEKQKEPAEWSAGDGKALMYLHELISWGYVGKFMDAQTAHDMRKWVNEHLRPHCKPSEEQEEPEYYQHFDPDC